MTRAYDEWLTIALEDAISPKPMDDGLPSDSSVAGLESVAISSAAPTATLSMGGAPGAETPPPARTMVINRGGDYHVWLSTISSHDGFIDSLTPDSAAVLAMWLRSLPPETTVYIYPGSEWSAEEGGGAGLSTIDAYLTILNALYVCEAKTIFIIDRMISGIMPYVAFACKEVRTTDYGHVAVYPTLALRDGGNWVQALTPFTHKLYERAVATGLLTQDEANSVIAMNTVFVDNPTLLDRLQIHCLAQD